MHPAFGIEEQPTSPAPFRPEPLEGGLALLDWVLAEQQTLTAVEQFARVHESDGIPSLGASYRSLLPATSPGPGQQYGFEVDLDLCSGCKACVTACHALNGLEDRETWRRVGSLVDTTPAARLSGPSDGSFTSTTRHVTTACHHCVDPACLNGCPVLAYDKDPDTGIVRHLDDQCIGCQYCVMMCPYEVPQYSERLGIVRKCDLCHHRLARNEAPACVQACPNEAIRIRLIDQAEVELEFRSPSEPEFGGGSQGHNRFLPDSPDPSITLPTTRFVTSEEWSVNARAADHEMLSLASPHWPLVIMLVLTQAAAGTFIGSSLLALLGGNTREQLLHLVGFALLVVGLLAATAHLGRPQKAWRSFLGWRRSWLSRELLVFQAFAAAAGAGLVVGFLPAVIDPAVRHGLVHLTAVCGLAGIVSSAMVYVATQKPWWSPEAVFGNFLGTTLLLGATVTAILQAGAAPGTDSGRNWIGPAAVLSALGVRTWLFVWRRGVVKAALGNPHSPIHLSAKVIRQRLPWTAFIGTLLFGGSTGFGLLALFEAAGLGTVWATVAGVMTLAAEILARYLFFAANSGRRMPGGIIT